MKISTRLKILMFLPLILVISTLALKFWASVKLDQAFYLERLGDELVQQTIDIRELTEEFVRHPQNPRPNQLLRAKYKAIKQHIDLIERQAKTPRPLVLSIQGLQQKASAQYQSLASGQRQPSSIEGVLAKQKQALAIEQMQLTSWDLLSNARLLREFGRNELTQWYSLSDHLLLGLIAAVAILLLTVGQLAGRRIRDGLLMLNRAVSTFAAGNYSVRLNAQETDEFGDIARAFDGMADGLRFRQMVEAAPNAMVMIDQQGAIEMVNSEAEKIFGHDRGSLLGQSIDILLPERFRHQHTDLYRAFFTDAVPRADTTDTKRDLFGQRRDGSEFPIEISLNPIVTETGAKVLSSITDLSARQQVEAERFRQVFEAAPYAMLTIAQDGSIDMLNAQAEKIFAYERAALLGQAIERLLPAPFDVRHPASELRNDLLGRRQDGSEFPVEIGLSTIETAEGAKVLAAIADISERVAASLRLAEHRTELERSNKDLETFAYVASHDLKSPLRGIAQLANWIEEDLQQMNPSAIANHMTILRSRVQRMENLLDDLLAYSRAGKVEGSLSYIEVDKLARNLFEMQTPPPGMQLIIAKELPAFTTLSAPFEQVLRNLFSNAIKHHDRPEGRVELTCRMRDGDKDNSYYTFSIHDDGPGIPPQYQERVFGMFQTLRPRDEVEGSGMGLALVKKIVESYGGETTIQSDGVRGCCVSFTWPLNITRRLKYDLPT